MNQEIWISPEHQSFPLPGWYVDFKLVHIFNLEDIEKINEHFCVEKLQDRVEAEILLAMEWYNQSFQKYSVRSIAGHLVDIAIAFETLLQLPRHGKTAAFKKQIKEALGLQNEPLMDDWAGSFYKNVRSATVHSGKPEVLLFRHPEAHSPHLGFLLSAQRIFCECISAKLGLPRHISNDRLVEELTPNEVHLSTLREAGSFDNIQKRRLLEGIRKLRQVYPPGKREHIAWLGKELLRTYKKLYMAKEKHPLPTLDPILYAKDDDRNLSSMYYQFVEEFRPIYFSYIVIGRGEFGELEHIKPKPISLDNLEQVQLEDAIYHFAEFAGWALSFI